MSRRVGILIAVIVLVVVGANSATATVTFIAPDIVYNPSGSSQTITADVLISDTNTSDIINDFQLDLFVQSTSTFNSANPGSTGDLNVAYGATTGFDFNTTSVTNNEFATSSNPPEPYLYNNNLPDNSNNSNDITFASPLYLQDYTTTLAGPNQASVNEIYANDTWANTDSAQMTQTWALARIQITIAGGFFGTEYLVWNNNGTNNDPFAPFYSLSTATTNNLDPTLIGGIITPGPEPGSIALMFLGAIGLWAAGWRRRRRG